MNYRIRFRNETHPEVHLKKGEALSEHLTIENSPVLFGCRTGICGTCLIEVDSQENGQLEVPTDEEVELLSLLAPGNDKARLACQIQSCADIQIWPLDA